MVARNRKGWDKGARQGSAKAGPGGPSPCLSRRWNSQPRRVQDCAGSLMEEVARADCVSAGWGPRAKLGPRLYE